MNAFTSRMCAPAVMFAASLLCLRCKDDATSSPRHAESGAGFADGGDGGERITCPTNLDDDLPTGPCSGAGSCAVEISLKCGPGVKFVPAGPRTYSCSCVAHEWRCELLGGGLGVLPCDGGADQ